MLRHFWKNACPFENCAESTLPIGSVDLRTLVSRYSIFRRCLTDSHQASHGFDELLRRVTDAVLENDLDLFDVVDVFRWIAIHNDDVGGLVRCDGPDVILLAKPDGTVLGRDVDRLFGSE